MMNENINVDICMNQILTQDTSGAWHQLNEFNQLFLPIWTG